MVCTRYVPERLTFIIYSFDGENAENVARTCAQYRSSAKYAKGINLGLLVLLFKDKQRNARNSLKGKGNVIVKLGVLFF